MTLQNAVETRKYMNMQTDSRSRDSHVILDSTGKEHMCTVFQANYIHCLHFHYNANYMYERACYYYHTPPRTQSQVHC